MFDNLTRRLSGVFAKMRGKGRLNEDDVNEMLREVRVALLEADVNFTVAKQFIASVKQKAVGEELFSSLNADQTLIKIVKDELEAMLGGEAAKMNWGSAPPTVILMCGLQGSGKTTTTAKLAKWFLEQGKKPMLAACDIQRPAAVKQLEVLGEQVGVPVFTKMDGTKPPQIAKEALERCKYLLNDVLIVDTAGRTTIDDALMSELEDIYKAVNPHESFLVLDATTGQEAVNVAEAFHSRVNVTGAIFTKMDGDTRGGAILSVRSATNVPVRFTGIGEQVDALEMFYPDRIAQRILGMGDVLGLIEKVEKAFDAEDTAGLEKSFGTGQMDFNMMLQSFKMMKKMGNMKNIVKLIPGLSASLPEGALDQVDDKQIGRTEAMILSMTFKERINPDIINGSRRKRIAAGSGTSVEEVNHLIKQMYEMRRGMKQMSKMQTRYSKLNKRKR
ncbi:MAG: signal recognition particle protein [Armatimonadota bacterium]